MEHKKTHTSFLDDIIDIKNNKKNKPFHDVIVEVISYLSKWLVYHIYENDQYMIRIIQQLKKGIPLRAAKLIAEKEILNSKNIILDTLLHMYDIFSNRSLDLMREKSLRKKAEEELKQTKK